MNTPLPSPATPAPDWTQAEIDAQAPRYSFRNAAEIAEMELPPQQYAWGGIPLTGGYVAEIIGPGGIGKSRLMLWIAVCQIRGQAFPSKEYAGQTAPLTWLFFGTENSIRRWQVDLRKIWPTLKVDERKLLGEHLYLPTLEAAADTYMTLDDEANVEKCKATLRAVNPNIVVFDPFGDLCADELKDDVQRETVRTVREIARSGKNPEVPAIILNHSRMGAKEYAKARTDAGNYGKNSKAIYSQCRAVFNLRPAYTDRDSFGTAIEIIDAKHNDRAGFSPVAVKLDPATMTYSTILDFDHDAAQTAWEDAAKGRGQFQQSQSPLGIDILPYVLAELDAQREAARNAGVPFRGVCLGALGECVRKRINADGKSSPGKNATIDLVKGLPPDKITRTTKTKDGILVGTPQDMAWYRS